MGKNRFTKSEKLTSRKLMDILFAKGMSRQSYPLKCLYIPHPDSDRPTHQVLISVPSRNFRKATDRNKLKRRIREAYRLNKTRFSPPPSLCLAYIYIARDIQSSEQIHTAVRQSLENLKNLHEKRH